MAPSFIYSAMVMQEPVAYFDRGDRASTSPRVRLRRRPAWSIARAAIVGLVAPFVRDQLILVPALMVASIGVHFVCFGTRSGTRLARASTGERVAAWCSLAVIARQGSSCVVARAGLGEVQVAFELPGHDARSGPLGLGSADRSDSACCRS